MHCLSKRFTKIKNIHARNQTKNYPNSPTCAIIFHYFSVAPYLTNIVLLGGISGGRSWK